MKKNAAFRYPASIEELNMDAARGIDLAWITNLATGAYLKSEDPVLICGATGCGKIFPASEIIDENKNGSTGKYPA